MQIESRRVIQNALPNRTPSIKTLMVFATPEVKWTSAKIRALKTITDIKLFDPKTENINLRKTSSSLTATNRQPNIRSTHLTFAFAISGIEYMRR